VEWGRRKRKWRGGSEPPRLGQLAGRLRECVDVCSARAARRQRERCLGGASVCAMLTLDIPHCALLHGFGGSASSALSLILHIPHIHIDTTIFGIFYSHTRHTSLSVQRATVHYFLLMF